MKTRVVSAVVAALFFAGIYAFWNTKGLYAICFFATAVSLFEYSRLAFREKGIPLHLRLVFFAIATVIYTATVALDEMSLQVFVLGAIVFLTMGLLSVQTTEDLPTVLNVQSSGLTGFIYCAIFPALATKLLAFPKGDTWLFGLLGIVFAGDTFAYITGRFFGKNKLLEAVSPKKTIEGSIGGFAGSAMTGYVLSYFTPDVPLHLIVITALATGVFAQIGDLFESLLKRVAEVKDSGSIMPGHGGVLDRVDGVYFAAPVYYVAVRFLVS